MPYPGSFDSGLIARARNRRLAPEYDPARPISYFVSELLALARERGVGGPVAAHLVGANLHVRFPNRQIRNTAYGTLEAEPGVFGDFDVGDASFNVTAFPTGTLYEKCMAKLGDGKLVYIVTPSPLVYGTFLAAEHYGAGRIVVTSVEDFVSLSVDAMSEFAVDESKSQLKRLLVIYNQRVDDVETDKSLLIKLPSNL